MVQLPSKCVPVACAHSIGAQAVRKQTSVFVRMSYLHWKSINRYAQMLATSFSVDSEGPAPSMTLARGTAEVGRGLIATVGGDEIGRGLTGEGAEALDHSA